jgi:hypothetical protein
MSAPIMKIKTEAFHVRFEAASRQKFYILNNESIMSINISKNHSIPPFPYRPNCFQHSYIRIRISKSYQSVFILCPIINRGECEYVI